MAENPLSCPQCKSTDLVDRGDKINTGGKIYYGVNCAACGYKWSDLRRVPAAPAAPAEEAPAGEDAPAEEHKSRSDATVKATVEVTADVDVKVVAKPPAGDKPEGEGEPEIETRIVRREDGFKPNKVKVGQVVVCERKGKTVTAKVAKRTFQGVWLELPDVRDPWVPFKDILGRVEPAPAAGDTGEARA